jgi:hypothetical protein
MSLFDDGFGVLGIDVGVGNMFRAVPGGTKSDIEKVLLEWLSEGLTGMLPAEPTADWVDALNHSSSRVEASNGFEGLAGLSCGSGLRLLRAKADASSRR